MDVGDTLCVAPVSNPFDQLKSVVPVAVSVADCPAQITDGLAVAVTFRFKAAFTTTLTGPVAEQPCAEVTVTV